MKKSIFTIYWNYYGGIKSVLKSRFFHWSLLLTFLFFPYWSKPGWWDDVINIMPNLLGFTLGGFALWISMGDEKFRLLICGHEKDDDPKKPTPFMGVNASFMHFIFIQILSLVLSLILKAYYFPTPPIIEKYVGSTILNNLGLLVYGFSFLTFIYAILLGLAASLAIFRVSRWYDLKMTRDKQQKRQRKKLRPHRATNTKY